MEIVPSTHTDLKKGDQVTTVTPVPIFQEDATNSFKPATYSGWMLGSLFLVSFVLFALVEVACHTLPKVSGDGFFEQAVQLASGVTVRDLHDRQSAETTNGTAGADALRSTAGQYSTFVPQPGSSLYLNLNPTSTSRYVPVAPGDPPPNSYLKLGTSATMTAYTTVVGDPPPKSYLNMAASSTPVTHLSVVASSTPNNHLISMASSISHNLPSTLAASTPKASQAPAPTAFLNMGTTPVVQVSGISSAKSAPSQTTRTSVSSSSSSSHSSSTHESTLASLNTHEQIVRPVHTQAQYFVGTYLPTILAVIYSIPFVIIRMDTNAMEPFYRLSKPGGASAGSTVSMDYYSLFSPLRALFYRQWAVVVAGIMMMLSVIIVPLAPETVAVRVVGDCKGGCIGTLGVFRPAARAIQALIIAIIALIIVFAILNRRRRTAVMSDPRSLAGLATLLGNERTRRDFQALPPQPNEKQLKRALAAYTYQLQRHVLTDGTSTVDLLRIEDRQPMDAPPPMMKLQCTGLQSSVKLVPSHRILASIFALLLIGLLVIVVVYRYTYGDTGFERFMDSQGFGVRLLFTLIGVVMSLLWKRVYQTIALLAPYRALALRNALPRPSILANTPTYPLISLPGAMRNGQHILGLVSLSAILADVLPVTLSAVPFNAANSFRDHLISTWLSASIIVLMTISLVVLFFYKEPELPVQPTTIAARMWYLSSGRVGSVVENANAKGTMIANRDSGEDRFGSFGMGSIVGMDGVTRVGIDIEVETSSTPMIIAPDR